MSNKLSAVLILCISTMCLSGCYLLRVTGPCYGVGCPAGAAGRNGQYKQGEGPKAENAPAPAPANSASAPNQTAAAQPNSVQPGAPAQTASASPSAQATAAQPAPTQDASSEAKSSPLHSVGEFFARLIPHHSTGAKSGASE
jgi:hypothetical protein